MKDEGAAEGVEGASSDVVLLEGGWSPAASISAPRASAIMEAIASAFIEVEGGSVVGVVAMGMGVFVTVDEELIPVS